MNRQERRAASRGKPSGGAWEVLLVPVPVTVQGASIEGVLLVVEADGLVRSVAPLEHGTPLGPVVRVAATKPMAGRPTKVPVLRCSQPELAARLRSELAGVRVELVARLPGADAAAEALRASMQRIEAPGVTVEVARFAAALTGLCRAEPWDHLDDGVLFTIADGPLAGGVAVVLGNLGEQQGLVLHRSLQEYAEFRAAAMAGAPPRGDACCVWIDAEDDFEPAERARCRALGMALPGGRMPRVVSLAAGNLVVASPDDQRALLAAIEVVVAACHRGSARLARNTHVARADTVLGPLSATVVGEPEELLVDADYATALMNMHSDAGEHRVGLVLKLGKRDAEKLARQLDGIDTVALTPEAEGTGVLVARHGTELGLVTVIDEAPELEQVRASGWLNLVIASGGAKRDSLKPNEIVAVFGLQVADG